MVVKGKLELIADVGADKEDQIIFQMMPRWKLLCQRFVDTYGHGRLIIYAHLGMANKETSLDILIRLLSKF